MILWKRILANDFGLNDFYLFIDFRRKKEKREMCLVLNYVYSI